MTRFNPRGETIAGRGHAEDHQLMAATDPTFTAARALPSRPRPSG
ncbi:hypothetical protein I553_3836 [Mycobacterium xenopi 4042]|uniref:Uncharacterized protein n=1 Tax=Mycobacterium xenopi 4042 TaxID=1299334 RepID=X7YV13_MYCXE|nr:hypothetical protein I553_3836 [Mycobacterium xenopi 4042]